ncbi:Hsp20/alpha crystallin family protein [Xanthomonas sp. AmX2]|nr:Hsp20/alpha crystallin family protein [Xanthomonas sp.]
MIPWNRHRSLQPVRDGRASFAALHRDMNRLFDELWQQADALFAPADGRAADRDVAPAGTWPSVEVAERDQEIVVSAELPGLRQDDVEVTLDDGSLVLRGERASERHDRERRLSERYYGRFERRIPLHAPVLAEQARAEFRDGVLSVTLPKDLQAQPAPIRIPVGTSS